MAAKPAARYVALIRGINVGGHARMTMADLRAVFEACGARDVATYIQSGNVLFASTEADRERLARRLADRIEATLALRVAVFVLTPAELAASARGNPLDPRRITAEHACHLMFLSAAPAADRVAALTARAGTDYRCVVRGRVLYYAYPRVVPGSRRALDFEKLLGVAGTARAWNVVDRLIELCEEHAGGATPAPRAAVRRGAPARTSSRAANARKARAAKSGAARSRRAATPKRAPRRPSR